MPFDAATFLAETFADVERFEDDLHGYQHDAADFLYENPFSLLWQDMGLGKTVSILELLAKLYRLGELEPTLIVAPIRVARQTWPTEIEKWSHSAWMPYAVIRGEDDDPEVEEAVRGATIKARAACDRLGYEGVERQQAVTSMASKARTRAKNDLALSAMNRDVLIHIINREKVDWLIDQFSVIKVNKRGKPVRILKRWPWKTVVIDESTGFKDHASQRFKALAQARHFITRLHELTATPALEGYMGLFAQTYLVDQGERLGRNITHFRENYFSQNKYSHQWKILTGAAERIEAKISDVTLVMRAKDHLPRNEATIIERPITLLPRELATYKEFERSFVLELPDDIVIEAVNAGALNGKLCQLASGAVYDEDKRTHFVHDHKIEELKQLIEESQGSPILCAYWYKSSLLRLVKAFPKSTVMDKQGKAVDKWNAGRIPLLFAHPQGAGHGLNMQSGPGHTVAFFDLVWPAELVRQFIGRVDRQGQANPVVVYNFVAKGTVDEAVVGANRRKEDAQEVLFNRLQAIRKKLKRSR